MSLYYDESGSLSNGEEINWDVFIVVRIVIDYNHFVKCIRYKFALFQKIRRIPAQNARFRQENAMILEVVYNFNSIFHEDML